MITEDYVSFEVAKLLKEKGFNYYCNSYFDIDSILRDIQPAWDYNIGDYHFSAPTLQMAMKWLREVRNIFIQVDYIWSPKALYTYTFDIHDMKNSRSIFSTPYGESFDSYEEACDWLFEHSDDSIVMGDNGVYEFDRELLIESFKTAMANN